MPRTYVKKVGGRSYQNYPPENMAKAVKAVQQGMSQLAASKKFKVPRTTLLEKIHQKHPLKPGRPTVLTQEEEVLIAKTLRTVSDWGFPMTQADVRQVISKFVTKQGRDIPGWKNNQPGEDFVHCFAARNNLSTRLATNIKRQRAAVGAPQVTEFFNNIKDQLQNALPQNVYNYDETNITDDPGAKKVLVPRGTKRVERVQEHSRTSISVMVCGSATGDLLPPMVVYKAQHLYENWTIGGPKGTVYDSTLSGWFDMVTFEKWFFEILLPYTKQNSSPEELKIVIGDNLASHFSPRVVEAALDNNIYMTPLPANSTHLMQPLDVSFFAPMKRKWREVLDGWRKESRRKGSIPKEQFPSLLNRLWIYIKENAAKNLQSGFRSTGISPFSPETVLAKLPSTQSNSERSLDESLLEFLKESRGYKEETTARKRGKKIYTKPGEQVKMKPATMAPNSTDAEELDALPGEAATKAPNSSDTEERDVLPPKLPKKTVGNKANLKKKKSKTTCLNPNVKNTESVSSTSRGLTGRNINSNTDSYCSLCNCSYKNYTGKNDWICCVSCLKWVCGTCNLGSNDPHYECPSCASCSICLIDYSEYTNRKAWIKCVTCNKWICGHCNNGSNRVNYECPVCEDEC